MGVMLETPPPEAFDAIARVLPDLPPVEAEALRLIVSEEEAAASAILPHRIENIGVEAIASEQGVCAARTIGWRFLPDTLPGTAVELYLDGDGNLEFGALNQGPFVEGSRELLTTFDGYPDVEEGDYRVTLLRVPALYVVALWLHAQGEGEDMVIPLAPAPPEFDSEQTVFTVDEFDEALREAASRRMAAGDGPEAA